MQAPQGDYEGHELEATAHAHNYNRWILDSIRPYLGRVIAEVGAGQGNFTRELLRTKPDRLIAIEPSGNLFPRLQQTFADDPHVQLHHATLAHLSEPLAGSVDSAVYINVLEHIADDRGEIAHAYRVLAPGGYLCIFVPALPWLMTSFDASIGHHRRYLRRDLEQLVRAAGFDVVHARYFDLLGVVTWFFAFKVLRTNMGIGNVRLYDRVAVPVARALDKVLRLPLGKSLLVIARKPAQPAPRAGGAS